MTNGASTWEKSYSGLPPTHVLGGLEELLKKTSFGKYDYEGKGSIVVRTGERTYVDFFKGKFHASVFMFIDLYFSYGIAPVSILEMVERHVDSCDIDSHVVIEHKVVDKFGDLLTHQIGLYEDYHYAIEPESGPRLCETCFIMGPQEVIDKGK